MFLAGSRTDGCWRLVFLPCVQCPPPLSLGQYEWAGLVSDDSSDRPGIPVSSGRGPKTTKREKLRGDVLRLIITSMILHIKG